MSSLSVRCVTKIFGDRPAEALPLVERGRTRAEILEATGQTLGVAEVSFAVSPGETLVVMGLSGCGKSTLLRCVNRLIEPTRGRVTLGDVAVTELGPDELRELRRRRFGMVFQRFALLPQRTVRRNVELGLEIQGVAPAERRARAAATIEQVGLSGWEDALPLQLSGGMQQRVGLARALAVDPDVLLMDEAFSALDPLIRADMQRELVELQRRVRKTVLFISHDLDEALAVGDRILLMKDGRVVQEGTPVEIVTRPVDDYVRRFVEDVDKAKVVTAGVAMRRASDGDGVGEAPSDGDAPRVAPDAPLAEVLELLARREGGRLPDVVVHDGERAVGVIGPHELVNGLTGRAGGGPA